MNAERFETLRKHFHTARGKRPARLVGHNIVEAKPKPRNWGHALEQGGLLSLDLLVDGRYDV